MSELPDSIGTRKPTGRRTSLNSIESSVTRLLVSTKHLLESLTQWARQEADDKFVSDAYVKLGNDFRAAVRAFNDAGVEISDLGDVPKALRIVLESALSEAPTQENLDKFLPNIRTIIVNLLSRLKAKQSRAKEIALERGAQYASSSSLAGVATDTPPKKHLSIGHNSSRGYETTGSDVHEPVMIVDQHANASNDALAKLQKGNVISRRASKRFSAYQYAKLANFNNNQLTKLPEDLETNQTLKESSDGVNANKPEQRASARDSNFIFLRIRDQTKKVKTDFPVSLAHLRLLFVEKFAYSPGSSSFPEIYIHDPTNNVSYELEEQNLDQDITSGTLVFLKDREAKDDSILNIEKRLQALDTRWGEALSQISSQIKDSFSSFAPNLQSVQTRKTVDDFNTSKSRGSVPPSVLRELESELLAIKQVSRSKSNVLQDGLREIQSDITGLKNACIDRVSTSHRAFMEDSYSKLSQESDTLLTKVDDLQDTMEALRKDVAQRGVRLGPKQLKSTSKEISEAKKSLGSLSDYIAEGKPTWKKIWEAELDKVCEEQQFFNLQDDLTRDLDEDIKKIEETFELIEKCSLEQGKQSSRKNFASKIPLLDTTGSLHDIKDAVLNQVKSLIPDHEGRLDAIAKAERLREKERELTSLDKFQEELGNFVGDQKLKKSGGIEELENKRREKDLENLKSSFGAI